MSSISGMPKYYIGLSYENVRGLPSAMRVRSESAYSVKKIQMIEPPFETTEAYRIRLNVSGIKPKDIAVVTFENQLIVELEKEFNPFKLARSSWDKAFGIFRRKFLIPKGCDVENIYYRLEAGELQIAIMKESQKKQVMIPQVFQEFSPPDSHPNH